MRIIADLQIHSKYSRAVSPQMVVPEIAKWAQKKGIGLMATGDWTHPLWNKELKASLEEDGSGLLELRSKNQELSSKVLKYQGIKAEESLPIVNSQSFGKTQDGLERSRTDQQPTAKFLLSGEVSCIYSQGGKGRRIHTLIFAPDFATVDKINAELVKRGCNLMSDGRPIIGLTSIQLAEVVFSINEECLVIPAHIYTPWFSLFGSKSGFDSIAEAFGQYANRIYAIETGLSSDPAMNWRIKELDKRSILSFSDAHSGPKIGREATVFDLEELSFNAVSQAIKKPNRINTTNDQSPISNDQSTINNDHAKRGLIPLNGMTNHQLTNTKNHIAYTIEFYPEEGKYHYTGHRACNVRQSPQETAKLGTICPTCGKPLTVGVMHRVEELAGRSEADLKINKKVIPGTKFTGIYSGQFPDRPPYVMLVPLQEIISESLGSPVGSDKVQTVYEYLCNSLGGEFNVLLNAEISQIASFADVKTAEGVEKVRSGNIVIDPGYDGVFGVVKIWGGNDEKKLVDDEKKQLALF